MTIMGRALLCSLVLLLLLAAHAVDASPRALLKKHHVPTAHDFEKARVSGSRWCCYEAAPPAAALPPPCRRPAAQGAPKQSPQCPRN